MTMTPISRLHQFRVPFLFCALILVLGLTGSGTALGQNSQPGCLPADINCDGRIDISDLQQIAAAVANPTRSTDPRLDLNGDGVVDRADIKVARIHWRGAASAETDDGRFGYAVDDAGNVFLRWQMVTSVYTTPVEVLREPAPGGSPASGVAGSGIIATVSPITDDAVAIPLLGDHWETLRNGYEYDANEDPVPLNSINDVHNYHQAGTNPMLVDWLSSRDTGVAEVFGLGHFDNDFSATGIYRYWIRQGGVLLGPVEIDTSSRTRLPSPGNLSAFDGAVEIDPLIPTASDGTVNSAMRLRVLRAAHANIYLSWDHDLGLPESDPVWHNGFNVHRRTCDAGPSNCGAWEQINEYPIFPMPLPDSASDLEEPGDGRLAYEQDSYEFEFSWADFELNTAHTYCYTVTSLDILHQDGYLAPDACLQPPDYRPTGPPELVRIDVIHREVGEAADIDAIFNFDPTETGNEDWQRFELYRAETALAIWPDEWDLVTTLIPNECGEDMVITATGLQEHEDYWYRVVSIDQTGNMSVPSTPRIGAVDDIHPPEAPTQCGTDAEENPIVCFDEDVEIVKVYRRFGQDGIPLLVDQVPEENFVWASWSDDYSPLRETEFFYELRGIDEAGNLGDPSAFNLIKVLAEGTAQTLIPPALLDASIDASLQGTLLWTTAGEANLTKFKIYRAAGEEQPNLGSMFEIGEVVVDPDDGDVREFSFTDNGVPSANQIYWYAIEAIDKAGNAEASAPYPARYVNLDDPSARILGTLPLSAEWVVDAVQLEMREEFGDEAAPDCCYIVLRSPNGVSDFTPISPILSLLDQFYFDIDVRPGDEFHYQVLRILAGTAVGDQIDISTARGEIVAASAVVKATGIPGRVDVSVPHTPPENLTYQPGPGDPPATLHFDTWDVTVTSYSNMTAGNLTGNGKVTLQPKPGVNTTVKVEFSGVTADNAGNVSAGSADVLLGKMLVIYDPRVLYKVSEMDLDKFGAKATVRILDWGPDFTLYSFANSNVGEPVDAASQNVFIEDPTLRFEHVIVVDQGCVQSAANFAFPFALRNWPLTLVPKEAFTLSETGVEFGATCTVYRDRFFDVVFQGVLDYRNDYYFDRIAASTEHATYDVTDGLSGRWVSLETQTYTAAFPFGFEIGSTALDFRFTNGVMTEGSLAGKLLGTDLSFPYDNDTSPGSQNAFSGDFVTIDLLEGGAISGAITSDDAISWTAYKVDNGSYHLYVPPVNSANLPAETWPASLGTTASGLPGDEREQPGLNAHGHEFTWTACPTPANPAKPLFPFEAGSDVDLFVRWNGVSGIVDMTTSGDGVALTLAGYDWIITRFAQGWLANFPYDSASAGRIHLPYPAEADFEFDELLLDHEGCAVSGSVLPKQEDLDYWQMVVTPWALFFDDANKLWIELETDIPNLARIDGNTSDPQIEVAAAFNPNGTFHDAEVFPEDTAYTVNKFYVVMNDFALSTYDKNGGNHEKPGWDETVNLAPAPCLPQENGCALTPGLDGGFIKLTAGVYLPLFGEATDPNSDQIFLLAEDDYVGFNRQPTAEHEISPALDILLQYNLLYAQSYDSGIDSRWVGMATSDGRDISVLDNFLVEVTIAEIPNAIVVEPNSERIFFGFPSATAMFLAANEAWETLPGNGPAPDENALKQRFLDWCSDGGGPFFSLYGSGWDCELESALAAFLVFEEGFDNYVTLIEDIEDKVDQHDGIVSDWLTDQAFGDVHLGLPLFEKKMANSPLQLQWLRGDGEIRAVTDDVGRIVDGELDLLQTDAYLTVYDNEPAGADSKTLLKGDFEMEWDPDGAIYLGATGVETTMADLDVRLDADMRLIFGLDNKGYGIEGGATLFNIETEVATVNKAGAVHGFTVDSSGIVLLYTGATLDLNIDLESIGTINVGGSMLFGRLDPNSPVLEKEYGDILNAMDPDPGMIIQGAYMQVYANNIPIFNFLGSCPGVKISGGGEVAFWVFTEVGNSNTAWGTRLGVNATGKALCVAAVKASVTLTLDNDFGEDNLDLTGNAWAGAGCGFCDVDSWTTQQKVRDDKGCLKCILTLDFVIPLKGSNTESDFDFSGECPF